jgi:hypothetical protein
VSEGRAVEGRFHEKDRADSGRCPGTDRLGFLFVIFPCTLGPLVMLLIALIGNNFDPERIYPVIWDFPYAKRALAYCRGKPGAQTSAPPHP